MIAKFNQNKNTFTKKSIITAIIIKLYRSSFAATHIYYIVFMQT